MDEKTRAKIEGQIANYRKERENALASVHALDGAITALTTLLHSEEAADDTPVPAN